MRGTEIAEPAAKMEPQDSNLSKVQSQSAPVMQDIAVASIPEMVAGAYYLPVVHSNIAEAWERVVDAMHSLQDTDVQAEEDFSAFGLKYYQDSFMMARSKFLNVEGNDQTFLELRKLDGSGFIFADQFKRELVSQLDGICQDVSEADPVAPEEHTDPQLAFLDLTDTTCAPQMIEQWLSLLRPSGGVAYDQMRIYEAVSSLGWNTTEENNMKVLADYTDDIVEPLLQVLALEETTFVPTVFFGSIILKSFVQADALDDEVKTWSTVAAVCNLMLRWSGLNAPETDSQITQSREVVRVLFETLQTLVTQVADEKDAKTTETISECVSRMTDMLPNKADEIAALSQAMGVSAVEDDA